MAETNDWSCALAVYLSTVANSHNQDPYSTVLNICNNPVITNTVFPKLIQLGTLQ